MKNYITIEAYAYLASSLFANTTAALAFERFDAVFARDLVAQFGAVERKTISTPFTATYECPLHETHFEWVRDQWGDSDGGDLIVHAALSAATCDAAYAFEEHAGRSEHDEPRWGLGVQITYVEICGQRVRPLQDNIDDFEGLILRWKNTPYKKRYTAADIACASWLQELLSPLPNVPGATVSGGTTAALASLLLKKN